jgi:hypothetical protein
MHGRPGRARAIPARTHRDKKSRVLTDSRSRAPACSPVNGIRVWGGGGAGRAWRASLVTPRKKMASGSLGRACSAPKK